MVNVLVRSPPSYLLNKITWRLTTIQAVRDCYPTCSYISFVAPGRRLIFDWLPLAAVMLLSDSYAKDICDDDPLY